jgi:Leucine-rich repeat (LRR) protein
MLDLPSARDDEARMPGADVDVERTLFQRYALAVLWYQTTDVDVVRMTSTGADVLDPFDVPYNPLDLTEDDVRWSTDENWMSGRGLCLWHGVTCHPGRHADSDPDEMYVPNMTMPSGATTGSYDGDFYVSALNLTNNNLYGILPREVFTAFDRLTVLDVSRNALEGTLGRELGMLSELEDLFVRDNDFSGEIPPHSWEARESVQLLHQRQQVPGQDTLGDGRSTKLRGASMFNNTLGGAIPDALGNSKDLIALYLDENDLTGQIPASLGRMTSMIDLRLRVNKFTGTIPPELGDLGQLESLYLDTNPSIGGTIPPELSKLAKLNEPHLYQIMDLGGSLPSELGLLSGLVYLYLDTNELTGPIPDEWGEMRDLEELFLTGNNLSGRLPITMRGLTSLQTLRAAGNELTGPIPSDMGKTIKLEYVHLEENDFSGQVPSQLGQLTKLKLLHLHDKNLSGVSSAICELKEGFVLRDLTADCEDMACSCCTCTP